MKYIRCEHKIIFDKQASKHFRVYTAFFEHLEWRQICLFLNWISVTKRRRQEYNSFI